MYLCLLCGIVGHDQGGEWHFLEQPVDGGHFPASERIFNVPPVVGRAGKKKGENKFRHNIRGSLPEVKAMFLPLIYVNCLFI